ncbi:sugar transferase [Mediterraneibacter butyricigenes]|uniref:Sugar transferase n=1 Tax=Mediterraneibacter butyricigenes TaxID=2316025 RepID=A0A391P9V4_9FIRM|nr:sugar transferase [Mediterraneibacter butyricigenes]GCA66499.1 sugar transferase [Mediterraneibacter butyricigenes]
MKREELTKKMRWDIAEKLAAERLPYVNSITKPVHPKKSFYGDVIKRIFDILISSFVLLLTFPINILIGIITLLDVGFPIFFKQERTGKDGKPFQIIKFRNMRETKDEFGELLPPDQRVTKFGRFVRKTSLDELLNFWSILKGDMSLIGPRPLVPEYFERYSDRHKMRLAVKPGLECPPRKALDHVWSWQEQFENDVWYVEHVSFLTDCFMIIKLITYALNKKASKARGNAIRGSFMGYDMEGTAISFEDITDEDIEKMIL